MAIAFCATASALHACLAQLPPATSATTVVCSGELLDPAALQGYTVVVLEAAPTLSRSYQADVENAVSMLSKQDKSVILSPSIVTNMVLALPELGPSPGAPPPRYIACLSTTRDMVPLLQAAELRLLMLDGDVYAWYAPEQEYLRLEGAGSAVLLTKNAAKVTAAGNSPTAVQVDVLTPGRGQNW